MKKFSVVVPVYNVEQYLDDCLRSLQAQTYSDYEVICVNDGSTDGSRRLLAEWAGRYPQMRIVDRENGGLSAARNSGTDVAEGEYIVYVDSDDWVSTDMLEKLASAADGADMLCYACQRTDNKPTTPFRRGNPRMGLLLPPRAGGTARCPSCACGNGPTDANS